MTWGSWEAFWQMGGYGPYVWGSMTVVFGLLVAECAVLVTRRRQLLRRWREAAAS
ncbi:MAG: heme exporter protein CcmD [Aquabacterium sp.]